MTRHELEAWLCGDGAPHPTPAEIAALLGVTRGGVGDWWLPLVTERLAGARFTLAVLRDLFPDDDAVRGWLRAPRAELGGRSAVELLCTGRAEAVEAVAVREWNGRARGVRVPARAASAWRRRATAAPRRDQAGR